MLQPKEQYRNIPTQVLLARLMRKARQPRPCHCCGQTKKEK